MKKYYVNKYLRISGLLMVSDYVRYVILKALNHKKNRYFKKMNPEVILPPDYLMYESFQLDYKKYYDDSRETAIWLRDHFKKHVLLQNIRILDWGCGPGRIIRHLPDVINNGCSFYGTDYNAKTIDWCKQNIQGVSFNQNTLEAKLTYKD
jgi:SAM-dependent methyltransferase